MTTRVGLSGGRVQLSYGEFNIELPTSLLRDFLAPNAEPALEGVDPLIAKLHLKIRRVDNEILEAVREQSSSGTKAKEDLDNAMKAIMARCCGATCGFSFVPSFCAFVLPERDSPASTLSCSSVNQVTEQGITSRELQELNGHIQEIKTKADQSEAMVQEICRDIKKLDYAKKHLTSTITALRRLGMLGEHADPRRETSHCDAPSQRNRP